MGEFDLLLSNALDKYFTSAMTTGHVNYREVYNLIVLDIINDLPRLFGDYITEEDKRSIINVLSCINGSCLIDYWPVGMNEDSLFREVLRDLNARISQESIIRHTEDGIFRIKA